VAVRCRSSMASTSRAADGGVGGEETVALINERGGDGLFVQTDISQAAEVDGLVARTVDACGGLHRACNCAGIAGTAAARLGRRCCERSARRSAAAAAGRPTIRSGSGAGSARWG
jgi:NAD(P)-dependent dehydrogenase (short-subunit alcohol dehydrogenase family)